MVNFINMQNCVSFKNVVGFSPSLILNNIITSTVNFEIGQSHQHYYYHSHKCHTHFGWALDLKPSPRNDRNSMLVKPIMWPASDDNIVDKGRVGIIEMR
jgi:hypothetical protein